MDKSTFLHSHTLEATHMRIRPPPTPPLLSPPRLFSCAAASARPRTLRDSPRVVCGLSSPGSPPRSATAPLSRPGVLPPLRTPVTDCPHAPRLRPSPPPDRLSLLPASSPALPPRRGLVPSGTRRAWCVGSPLRGLRLARPPLRYRVPASSLRSEPRLLTARTLRGSVPPRLRRAHCRLYYGSR